MKFAIFSDIHANLEALQAILKDAQKQGATRHACLGDIVGYGANPQECIALIQELNCPVVKGNHDEYAAADDELVGLNASATEALLWTRQKLGNKEKEWLRRLPYVHLLENFTLVHASMFLPHQWNYVLDPLTAALSFRFQNSPVCFYGHTHTPIAFVSEPGVQVRKLEMLTIESAHKYLVNVGSVGQPRDRDPRAAYVLYDLPSGTITLRRVPYDIETAKRKIIGAKLPLFCAIRLETGK